MKESKKPPKPEEEMTTTTTTTMKKKSGAVEIKGHGGVPNGVVEEDETPAHVNGEADAVQSGSAFSSPDAKACDTTSPYLTNALSLGAGGVAEALLGGVAEALLALEE